MQFLYHEKAGLAQLLLTAKSHHYLSNVKRISSKTKLNLRNLQDDMLYRYGIITIDKKHIELELEDKQHLIKAPKQFLRLACCIIDLKAIEKILPMLNQLGLSALALVYCDYSQAQLQVKDARLRQILLNSCMQCGRSSLMQIEHFANIKAFLARYKQVYIVDFKADHTKQKINYKTIQNLIVGPEGGFSSQELTQFTAKAFVGFDHDLILKSEVASLAAVAKILL